MCNECACFRCGTTEKHTSTALPVKTTGPGKQAGAPTAGRKNPWKWVLRPFLALQRVFLARWPRSTKISTFVPHTLCREKCTKAALWESNGAEAQFCTGNAAQHRPQRVPGGKMGFYGKKQKPVFQRGNHRKRPNRPENHRLSTILGKIRWFYFSVQKRAIG